MIDTLPSYPAYKDSGLPWLGQVPEHWEVQRAKFLLREVDSRSQFGTEQLLRVSQYTGVTQRKSLDDSDSPDTRASSLVGYKIVEPDDLVINIMLAWNGSMGVSRYNGIASPAYCVYRFKKDVLPWYFHELLRTPIYKQRIKTASTGVVESRLRLYSDDLGRLELPLPPPAEQAAIVRFLEWAGGRLERTIRAKRKIIALLNEQKQAIIHRAVTRGLDPNVPLKDSGIPWLGEIPAHWEVVTIRSMSTLIQTGPFGSQLHSHEYIVAGIPVINPSHMANGYFKPSLNVTITAEKAMELSRHKLHSGDIVIARRGDLGRCARVTNLEEGWICGTGSLLLRCKALVSPEFFRIVFSSRGITDMLSLSSIGATMENLNAGVVARQRIPLPPISEQEKIVVFISLETDKVNTAISRLEREIELLREYRTRLISDVVTGKLDVRAAAATLPDEPSIDSLVATHDVLADDADEALDTTEDV